MRSVVVVLPASMCAMMPILRTLFRSSSTSCATGVPPGGVVCEGWVRLGHLVSVFTALHRCTETVGCVQDLVGEPLGHCLLAAIFCIAGEPAQRKGVGAGWFDINRHRVGGAADPP